MTKRFWVQVLVFTIIEILLSVPAFAELKFKKKGGVLMAHPLS